QGRMKDWKQLPKNHVTTPDDCLPLASAARHKSGGLSHLALCCLPRAPLRSALGHILIARPKTAGSKCGIATLLLLGLLAGPQTSVFPQGNGESEVSGKISFTGTVGTGGTE